MPHDCLICREPIHPLLFFGKMPIANGFLSADAFHGEYFFNLTVGFCHNCKMVQLTDVVDRDRMFHDHYAFWSSTSTRMAAHFEALAHLVMKRRCLSTRSFVVEIGSNDGILLRHFAACGIPHLGVEPSRNVAHAAIDRGVQTLCSFFDETLADDIVSQYGKADIVLAANVICHIPYLHSVMAGVNVLLKPGGLLIFEDPYLGDIVRKTAYDQFYDEHAFYFSATSVTKLLEQHGLQLVDIVPQQVHGGSMRYIVSHWGACPVSTSVSRLQAGEEALGLHRHETFDSLRQRVERSRDQLIGLLERLHDRNMRIVGYGATAKGTTVINYCGLTSRLVEYISDTTPIKQGKFSPGMHIPVRPHATFTADQPDFALLFAWNHRDEIRARERHFESVGGKWITYVPHVKVLGAPHRTVESA